MGISDFTVMSEMATKEMDIGSTTSLVSATTAKGGGHVTMGIDQATVLKMALNPDKYVAVLYVINREEFFATKKTLIKPDDGILLPGGEELRDRPACTGPQ